MAMERHLLEMLRHARPNEMREMGELLISLADEPRGKRWNGMLDAVLAKFPDPEPSDLVQAIEAGRARVKSRDDAQYATGWHPVQMRAELEARGYQGLVDA